MIDTDLKDRTVGAQRPPEHMSGPFLEFDLRAQIELLRSEEAYEHGHNSKTVAKYPDFRVVLTAMKAGASIHAHTTSGRISVQTITGHIRMHVGEKLLDLPAGRLLVLDKDVRHDVLAVDDSAFVLTVAWPRNAE
jgi:quercetin dioxygenase-like cupin family protein